MKLTFGKYKGSEVEDLPQNYLEWLCENHSDTQIVSACRNEILCRKEPTKGITTKLPEAEFMSALAELLRKMRTNSLCQRR